MTLVLHIVTEICILRPPLEYSSIGYPRAAQRGPLRNGILQGQIQELQKETRFAHYIRSEWRPINVQDQEFKLQHNEPHSLSSFQ